MNIKELHKLTQIVVARALMCNTLLHLHFLGVTQHRYFKHFQTGSNTPSLIHGYNWDEGGGVLIDEDDWVSLIWRFCTVEVSKFEFKRLACDNQSSLWPTQYIVTTIGFVEHACLWPSKFYRKHAFTPLRQEQPNCHRTVQLDAGCSWTASVSRRPKLPQSAPAVVNCITKDAAVLCKLQRLDLFDKATCGEIETDVCRLELYRLDMSLKNTTWADLLKKNPFIIALHKQVIPTTTKWRLWGYEQGTDVSVWVYFQQNTIHLGYDCLKYKFT